MAIGQKSDALNARPQRLRIYWIEGYNQDLNKIYTKISFEYLTVQA